MRPRKTVKFTFVITSNFNICKYQERLKLHQSPKAVNKGHDTQQWSNMPNETKKGKINNGNIHIFWQCCPNKRHYFPATSHPN